MRLLNRSRHETDVTELMEIFPHKRPAPQSCNPNGSAAAAIALKTGVAADSGFQIIDTRDTLAASLRSSSRLPSNSLVMVVRPVTFPPGRAKLATNPLPTGLPTAAITIGMVVVACLAARVCGTPAVTITSTLKQKATSLSSGSDDQTAQPFSDISKGLPSGSLSLYSAKVTLSCGATISIPGWICRSRSWVDSIFST